MVTMKSFIRAVFSNLARVRQPGESGDRVGWTHKISARTGPVCGHHQKKQVLVEVSRMKKETSKLVGTSNDNHWRNNKINALIAIGMALGIGSAVAQTGNGALSGPHYNLNIIGTTQCPGDDMVGTMQHVIFGELFGGENPAGKNPADITPQNKIYLIEGDTFQVLDGNA